MINEQYLKTVLDKTENQLQIINSLIDRGSHFFIFPFEIQGCINVTETGIKPEALNISDYTYFSKVVGGDHPVVATWEKSSRWIGKPKRYSFMQCELGAKKHYSVGRYFKGMVTQDVHGLAIGANKSWGTEMTHLQENTTISLMTTKKIEREDIFRLWIIKRYDATDTLWVTPDVDLKTLWDKNQIQFLYLAKAENFYSYSGTFMHCKLTFESLNDKLANSGYSIANYVQLALGGGYAWPRLRLKETYNPDYPLQNQVEVFVDPLRTIDVGVWGFQIKLDNTAIIHSVRLMGYPTFPLGDRENDKGEIVNYDSGYVFAPRPIFPKYFLPAVNHPLNLQLKAEENFVLVPGIQPMLDFYQDWKENKKTAYNEMIQSAFEGHLRTNYKAVTKAYGLNDTQGKLSSTFERLNQIWKNIVIMFEGRNMDPRLPVWPDWLVDRIQLIFPALVEGADAFLDMFRSVFSNVFSRKIPQFGTVNEKISYVDLKAPTIANILALNAFAHHDLITLPIGINQTITTESLDTVNDVTARIPVLGGLLNTAIEGFHNLVFGKSPSGFKKGGVDTRLAFYGDMMVGIMSAEMYLFYTAPRKSNNDVEAKGIIPFNAFQEQSDDALSQMVSAKANSTVLNLNLTDIAEMGVYDTKDPNPKQGGYKTEIVSTVHIGQQPHFDNNECGGTPLYPKYDYQWKKSDTILVDKNFNLLLDPRDEEMIIRFGFDSDNKRLFILNEVCIQALGAGDIVLTAFAQDPTVYGYEQVVIWEGKFRSYASVKQSTRAWTTTIRMGQPVIYDEDGNRYNYGYPRTILADIQKRPNLPPQPPGKPKSPPNPLGVYIISMTTGKNWDKWKAFEETVIAVDKEMVKGKQWIGKPEDRNTKHYLAFYDDTWEVDFLPMFETVGDPTSDDQTKLSAGILAYRNMAYKGAEIRVELYHSPYEHFAGDAYSYWDDNPKKAVEQLQRQKPSLTFPLFGYEEGVSVGADVEAEMFGIQELGTWKVVERNFERELWIDEDDPGYLQPPASTLPLDVPDIKHTCYLQDFR